MNKILLLLILCFGGIEASAQAEFITTWKTDNIGNSNSTSITIPTFTGETYSYDVDWDNDGIFDDLGITGDATHDYGVAGTYTVAIKGSFPRIYFNNSGDQQKLLSIDQWGTNAWSSMNSAFFGCFYLQSNALDTPNLTDVSDMSHMFDSAQTFNQDIDTWDVSNVTDMSFMFSGAFAFNGKISNWNVGNVTDMTNMFSSALAFNQDIGAWNVGNVTDMSDMFSAATSFNQNIGSWNVGLVTDMSQMFEYAFEFNQDIGSWDVSNVTNMSYMFSSASNFDQNIGSWDVSNVTNMSYMFSSASNFDQNIGTWNVTNVTNMEGMFQDATLSTANYDALLIGWNDLYYLQYYVSFDGGNSTYCTGQAARDNMVNNFEWNIIDGGQQCASIDNFVTTWKTDNTFSGPISIIIPTFPGETYNYDVSWENDGNWENGFTGDATHDYAAAGTYTVAIRGLFPRIYFNDSGDSQKIISIDQWSTNSWTSMESAFKGCTNLDGNAPDAPNLIDVTDMKSMFEGSAFNQDIGNWDVSKVENMESTFQNTPFNKDIGNWDVSNVNNMKGMFQGSEFNQDIGNWDVQKVNNMESTFQDTPFNRDIGNWDVSNVNNMKGMFQGSEFNQDIGNWDVQKVNNMESTFQDTPFNRDIGNWDVSNVNNMKGMFQGSDFNQDIGNWDVQKVNNMESTFQDTPFNRDIGNWDVSNVNNMKGMFQGSAFNQDIGNWDVQKVNNMESTFQDTPFNRDIGNWDVSNVTNMRSMFEEASAFNQDIGNWDVSNVTDMSRMFYSASAFQQDIGKWDVGEVESMVNMFEGATFLTVNYDALLIGWNNLSNLQDGVIFNAGENTYCDGESARQNIINTYGWTITDGGPECATDYFITTWKTDNFGTSNATSITIPTIGGGYNYDVSWNNDGIWETGITDNITHDYGTMGTYTVAIRGDFPRIHFNNSGDSQKIISIDQWGTNAWSSMEKAFYGCSNLEGNATDTPDLSNVTDMSSMFTYASVFDQDIGNWNVSNVTNMSFMFFGASVFNQNIGSWNVGNVTNMSYMFLNTAAFNQNLGGWNVSNVTNMAGMFFNASAFNQDLSNWDVANVTNMSLMFEGIALSTSNYDALLIAWNNLTLQNSVIFSGGNSKYCIGQAARENMITTYGWTITDGGPECATDYFITTWKTDNFGTSNATSITIPTIGGGYNYDVSWNNDGIWETGITDNITHDYGTMGTYTVAIRGDFPRIHFNNSGDSQKIISIDQWGTNAWSSMEKAFYGCSNLEGNATDTPDLSNVTDMSSMFTYASVFDQDIGNWNVSNVTNMSFMFFGASVFNQNIGSWNVGNVTNMSYMFLNTAAFNQNLGGWNVSNVTNMAGMFFNASAFNQDLSNWDVANVTNMSLMFEGIALSTSNYDALLIAWNNLTLQNSVIFSGGNSKYCIGQAARENMITTYGWNIIDGGQECSADYFITTWKTDNPGSSNATSITIPTEGGGYSYDVSWENDGVWETGFIGNASHDYGVAGTYEVAIRGAFPRIYFNNSGDKEKILSIEQWGTNAWSSMNVAFYGCSNLLGNAADTPDLSDVTDMSFMFAYATSFNQDIGNWNVGNVTDMLAMFAYATSFNQNIGGWNVGNVTTMNSMFYGASVFNQDIGNWNVSNVTNMYAMFLGVSGFNQNIGNWNVDNVTDMEGMFWGASAFNQDIGSWKVDNVTDMYGMFAYASAFNQNIGAWNVGNVTNMGAMFFQAFAFNQNIGGWNVTSVTDMTNMFEGVTLSTANYDALLDGWNTLTLQNGVTFSGGNSKYCIGWAARNNMTSTFGWTITDGGISEPPVAVCKNITVALNANGNVSITETDVDNGSSYGCAGSGTISVSPDTFDCSNIGDNTVTLTVTDANGNESTCISTVTVEDNIAPVITCAPNATRDTDPGVCEYTIVGTEFDATFTDNCAAGSISNDYNGTATLAGEVLPKGNTTVVWTVDDGNGQSATCITVITVEDNENPVITCASNATRDTDPGVCEYTVVGTEFDATFTDNCVGGSISNDYSGTATLAGEVLPKGNTTIVWTVDDGNGQTATCTTVITVEDNEAPIIACSPDITVNTGPGICGAIVNFPIAIAFDNCEIGTVAQSAGLPSGSQFPVGNTTIEFTATDVDDNSSTCSFIITVIDNEAPVAVCRNIAIQLDEFGNASIVAADVDGGSTDNCGVATTTISPSTFDCSNVGDNNVTLTVTDIHGNTATCTAIVTVEDVTAPVVACQNITVELGANGTVTILGTDIDNGSTDACGIASYVLDIDTFDCSNIGDNTVVLTVTDINGNAATCTATVTVEDNTSPVLVCKDFTLELGPNGTATLDPSDVIASNDDACGILTVAVDITQFSCADIGTPVTVQVFSQDNNGNLATCTATVTVVDLLAPEITCPSDQTVDPGAGNLYYILPDYFATGEATAVDNCTDPVTITTQSPAAGTPLPDGTYTIVLTATDEYGNTSSCEFELTVDTIIGVGENSQSLGTVTIYPVPTKDILNIGNPQNIDLERMEIYDLRGRLVQTADLRGMGSVKTINVDQLAAAAYYVKIMGKQGQITKRLLKE